MLTIKIVILFLGTLGLLWVSRRSLKDTRSHGFYRFLAWETILIGIILNLPVWFKNPWGWYQIISWILLCVSLVLVVMGLQALKSRGKPGPGRRDPALIGLEKTTQLVTDGIYHYIRHPMYASLLYLGWGVFFKYPSWAGLCLASVASFFLFRTASLEEQENIATFGESYQAYMQHTHMFIPFLW